MKVLTAFLVFVTMAVSCAWACDTGTVRDAAAHAKRDVHRLCVIAPRDDGSAKTIVERLEAWLLKAQTLNVTLERVNADDKDVEWQDYGIPSTPPEMPVVALIGQFAQPRRAFVIDHWQPGPTDKELESLASSPTRDALKDALTSRWAVLLYSPAKGTGTDSRKDLFEAVAAKWDGEQAPGISVVKLDRADPREHIICAFAGIDPSGPDWLGVVFGRGKLMAPPLEGDEITRQNINELLGRLAVACTCLQQALTFGLDIPMTWDAGLDAKIPFGTPQGYTEVALDVLPSAQPPATTGIAGLMADIPEEHHRVYAMAIAPLIVAGLVAVGAIIAIIVRRGNA